MYRQRNTFEELSISISGLKKGESVQIIIFKVELQKNELLSENNQPCAVKEILLRNYRLMQSVG
jgi:hypothetical protein